MKLSFQNGVLAVVVTLVHLIAISLLSVQPSATTGSVPPHGIPSATENSLTLAAGAENELAVEPVDAAEAPSESAGDSEAEPIDQPALPRVMKPLPAP